MHTDTAPQKRASTRQREAWAHTVAARQRWAASGYQDRESYAEWVEARAAVQDLQRGG